MTRSTKLVAAENRLQAIELRKSGLTLKAISYELGVSTTMVHKYINTELRDLAEETKSTVIEMRQLELERLDIMMMGLWEQSESGDVAAIDRVLKIMERRAKLLGLDSPQKIAPTSLDGLRPFNHMDLSEEEIGKRLDELEAKRKRRQPLRDVNIASNF
jgi:predicted transcriptional regulator